MARPDTILITAGLVAADLITAGRVAKDAWVSLDDAAAPPCGDVIVPVERLASDEGALRQHVGRLGVAVPMGTELDMLASWLPRLSLVALDVTAFRDGRVFSLARRLRERHGFTGEIRVRGHVLPDQYLFLVRCGVDTIEVRAGTDLSLWHEALRRFHTAYQPDAGAAPLSPLRRALPAS